MRSSAAFVLALSLAATVADAFIAANTSQQHRIKRGSASAMRMVPQSPSNSRYISFSADTGFLVSPSAFNAVLDRFELRKRLGILLNDVGSKCICWFPAVRIGVAFAFIPKQLTLTYFIFKYTDFVTCSLFPKQLTLIT